MTQEQYNIIIGYTCGTFNPYNNPRDSYNHKTSDVYMWKVRLSDLPLVLELINDKIGMH